MEYAGMEGSYARGGGLVSPEEWDPVGLEVVAGPSSSHRRGRHVTMTTAPTTHTLMSPATTTTPSVPKGSKASGFRAKASTPQPPPLPPPLARGTYGSLKVQILTLHRHLAELNEFYPEDQWRNEPGVHELIKTLMRHAKIREHLSSITLLGSVAMAQLLDEGRQSLKGLMALATTSLPAHPYVALALRLHIESNGPLDKLAKAMDHTMGADHASYRSTGALPIQPMQAQAYQALLDYMAAQRIGPQDPVREFVDALYFSVITHQSSPHVSAWRHPHVASDQHA
jgi:hypothetical protein